MSTADWAGEDVSAGEGPSHHQHDRAETSDEEPLADPESVARTICLRLLTGAPKTRAQLADALRRKNVPEDVAERVLDRLGEVGLVDDAAFAEAWVQSRHAGRGLARRALRSELRKRGVDDEAMKDAVDTLDEETELATARALVERKLPSTRRLDPVARFRRLAGMLARKGYPGGLAMRAVREALEADRERAATESEAFGERGEGERERAAVESGSAGDRREGERAKVVGADDDEFLAESVTGELPETDEGQAG